MIRDLVLFLLLVLGALKTFELFITGLIWVLKRIDRRDFLNGDHR